jgi:hypothetical protein
MSHARSPSDDGGDACSPVAADAVVEASLATIFGSSTAAIPAIRRV